LKYEFKLYSQNYIRNLYIYDWMLEKIYSSARGGARNKISAARDPIPKTGKKYPPKSLTLDAIT